MTGSLAPPRPGALRALADFRPGEGRSLALSAATFGVLLCAYYLLRPTREIFGIDDGPVYEWLWSGTALGTLLVTPLFGWLVSRFPRHVFVPIVYGGATVLLVGFWLAHRLTDGSVRLGVGYGFYVFTSVLAVLATAVFWGLLADGWRPEQARRLFGIISVGGTLGALAGSSLADLLLRVVTPRDVILVGAGCYALTFGCSRALARRLPGSAAVVRPAEGRIGWRAALDGVRLFVSSRYLLLIGAFLVAQTLAATFLYVESRAFTADVFPTRGVDAAVAAANAAARGQFFARVDLGYNALALGVQLFLVGRLVRWIGIGAMLASLPLVNLAGFVMLGLGPSLFAYGAFEVLQRGSRFAVMKPAREMLFTVVSRDEKYKAKQFLDTAVYRSSDAIWAWLDTGLRDLLGPVVLKFAFLVPACALWTGVAALLGRMHQRRTPDGSPATGTDPT